MKTIAKIISYGTVFVLGTGAGFLAQGEHLELFLSDYLPAVVTLVAAFYGAKFAFDFQNLREQRSEEKQSLVKGNLAIFNIVRMINSLLTYQTQIIDPVRDRVTAFIDMPATLPQDAGISIDLDSLAFFLNTEDKNLIGELSIEISRYDAAISAINGRSLLHVNEVQPRLETAGFHSPRNYSLRQINEALGNRVFGSIRNATIQVIESVDSSIISLESIGDKLTASMKSQFPNGDIISISKPDLPDNQ